MNHHQFKFLFPRADAGIWLEPLMAGMQRWGIDTPARQALFLAQIGHESGGLTRLTEVLNYSAERLMQVWPRRFRSLQFAVFYAHNPEKLANYVYASRLGNGIEATGDGYRYRGRGLIQITGRANYAAAEKATGLLLLSNPDLAATPHGAIATAGWFWQQNGLNRFADAEDCDGCSRRVNGGTAGLAERRGLWLRARSVLNLRSGQPA